MAVSLCCALSPELSSLGPRASWASDWTGQPLPKSEAFPGPLPQPSKWQARGILKVGTHPGTPSPCLSSYVLTLPEADV